MDEAAPPSDGPQTSYGDAPDVVLASIPPVVAVVVTKDPDACFDEALEALASSDYPELTVLVIDSGSEVDPTPRVALKLPNAFVRRIPENIGFAAAANEALGSVSGAMFLVFLQDDVIPDVDAIRLLVEEAYRSNAGIVGPKLVDYANPEVLVEVGLSIDRFGEPHSMVEPDEIDQEQHDGVRDVFYVSDAMMLVRADLFAELGGFDPATFPGGEDLDLCWRAGIAGARTMVAPNARAKHLKADHLRDEAERASVDTLQRGRLRSLLKNYSTVSLSYLAPVTFLLNAIEAIAFLISRRRDRARGLVRAWTWNLRNLGDLRAARRLTQAQRTVPDAELKALQFHGSSRLRHFFVASLHAEDRMRKISERSRGVTDTASSGARSPEALLLGVFAFFLLFGSRGFLFSRVAAVGQLPTWSSVSELVGTFTSAWRNSGLGSPAPPPPLLAGFATLGTALLGATSLARTLLVVAAIPVGVLGTWRLARRIAGSGWPAITAALVYGVIPVARNAIAAGRFGPIVFYAVAPFLLTGLLALAGYFEDDNGRNRVRTLIGTAALVALTTAAWPPAILFPVLVLVAFALGAPLARDSGARLLALASAALCTIGVAIALVLPWPFAFLAAGDRLAAAGFAFETSANFPELLRFATGSNGTGLLGWSFVFAAGLVILFADAARLSWVARLWMLAIMSFAVPFLVSRFAAGFPMPAIEGMLVPAALAVALAIGVGAEAFVHDVRSAHFGRRQFATLVGVIALAGSGLLFIGDSAGGRWHQPEHDWTEELSWMRAQEANGTFRVLWVGDASVIPVDPLPRGDIAYGVTFNGPGDARSSLPPPPGGASELVGTAVDMLRNRTSHRVGRFLAPMAVRYVAMPERPDPGDVPTALVPHELRAGLEEQIDLVRLEAPAGITLYENRAFLPGAALLPDETVHQRAVDPLTALDVLSAVPVTPGAPVPAGEVLWSQAFDGAWHANTKDGDLAHTKSFAWANGFAHPDAGTISFSYSLQWTRYLMVLLQIAIFFTAIWMWLGKPSLRRLGARKRNPRSELEVPSP